MEIIRRSFGRAPMNQRLNFTYHDRDIASVVHPQTNLLKHLETGPTIITHGDGVYIYDDTGKRFLDSGAALWCTSLGYKNERVARVAYEAMLRLPYFSLFRHHSNPPAIDLSEKLLEIAPVPMSKVLLQCSGSEANDSAVKIVCTIGMVSENPKSARSLPATGAITARHAWPFR